MNYELQNADNATIIPFSLPLDSSILSKTTSIWKLQSKDSEEILTNSFTIQSHSQKRQWNSFQMSKHFIFTTELIAFWKEEEFNGIVSGMKFIIINQWNWKRNMEMIHLNSNNWSIQKMVNLLILSRPARFAILEKLAPPLANHEN